MMLLNDFENACRRLAASSPRCSGWLLSAREDDFGREWRLTASSDTFSATVQIPAATVTSTTPAEVLPMLGKMLHELRTGAIDASEERDAIRRELRPLANTSR